MLSGNRGLNGIQVINGNYRTGNQQLLNQPSAIGLNLDLGAEWLNCSDKFSGKEIKLEWHIVNGGII